MKTLLKVGIIGAIGLAMSTNSSFAGDKKGGTLHAITHIVKAVSSNGHSSHRSGHSSRNSGHSSHNSGHSSHNSGYSSRNSGHGGHNSGYSSRNSGHGSHNSGHGGGH